MCVGNSRTGVSICANPRCERRERARRKSLHSTSAAASNTHNLLHSAHSPSLQSAEDHQQLHQATALQGPIRSHPHRHNPSPLLASGAGRSQASDRQDSPHHSRPHLLQTHKPHTPSAVRTAVALSPSPDSPSSPHRADSATTMVHVAHTPPRHQLPTPPPSNHTGRQPSSATSATSEHLISTAPPNNAPSPHHRRRARRGLPSETALHLQHIQQLAIQNHRQAFFQRALNGPDPETVPRGFYQSQQSKLQEAINSLTPPQKVLLFPEQCALPKAFRAKYVPTEELGSGGCGFALVARRATDWAPVCVKFIYKNRVSSHSWVLDSLSTGPGETDADDDYDTDDDTETGSDMDVGSDSGRGGGTTSRPKADEKKVAVPLEVYLLKNMRHDNIVGFLDVWEDPRHFILVMDLHGCPWDDSSKFRVPSCTGADPLAPHPMPVPYAPLGVSTPPLSPGGTGAPHPSGTNPPSNLFPAMPSAAPLCPCQIPPSMTHPAPADARTVVPKHPSTDLFECVEKLGVLTEHQARFIFRQVVEAVWYLHVVCGVVHRDIKDENIVVSHNLQVKIIDLGNSAFIPPRERPDLFFDRFYGTVQYCSPEVLCGKRYRGPEAEMWSLGVLLYTLLFSELPFADPSQTVHLRYARPRYQRSPAVVALLDRLLEKDPAKRATVEEVRACGWWAEQL